MSSPEEMEFSEHPMGGGVGEMSGDIGGEIFIPMEPRELADDGTLDEPVTTTLVCHLTSGS